MAVLLRSLPNLRILGFFNGLENYFMFSSNVIAIVESEVVPPLVNCRVAWLETLPLCCVD